MNYKYIEISQAGINMYLFKMNIKQLLSEGEILRYNSETKSDYQRPPIPAHYKKIANYLLNNEHPIMPTAILAAIDLNDVVCTEEGISFKKKIRIVDGQHRILGMECLNKGYSKSSIQKYKEFENTYEFPVVLMVIGAEDRFVEVDAFININSKGQRVKTDLAETLKRQKYLGQTQQAFTIMEEYKNVIAMGVAEKVNEKDEFWKGLIIQPDQLGKSSLQPISKIAFLRAIRPVPDISIGKNMEITNDERENIENKAQQLVSDAWDIVIKKWPQCFNGMAKFDSRFNICKGIGVVPLFSILSDFIDNPDALSQFKETLDKSKVTYYDWVVGGNFTGYASQQGFALIKQYILNNVSADDFN